MRVLLAGGGGFVGSRLAGSLLANGNEVVIVDNFLTGRLENVTALKGTSNGLRLELIVGDVRDLPDLRGRFDAILNLASPASPIDYFRYPLETLETGSTGTRNLLELAVRERARFLLASTSEVYGDPLIHPQPESYWGNVNPVGPRCVYDEAKRYAEALTSAYARKYGVQVRIARIFNTYGPGMRVDDGRVIPTLIHQALNGQPLTIYGGGAQTRCYCYVDDLVEGLTLLLESDLEGPVNLGNTEEYTVLATAELIRTVTKSTSPIVHLPPAIDDPQVRKPDITRAWEGLGWRPKISFNEGLKRTIADLRYRMHLVESTASDSHSDDGKNCARPHPERKHGHMPDKALGTSGSTRLA